MILITKIWLDFHRKEYPAYVQEFVLSHVLEDEKVILKKSKWYLYYRRDLYHHRQHKCRSYHHIVCPLSQSHILSHH